MQPFSSKAELGHPSEGECLYEQKLHALESSGVCIVALGK